MNHRLSRLAAPLAILVSAGACASTGAGSGLGAPDLVGTYELTGPFTHDGANPGVTYLVTFRPDGMYEYEEVGQIGRPPPPQRYRSSGDYVVFSVSQVGEVRVWRRAESGLAAEVRGRYVISTRTETYCALYRTNDDGQQYCGQYAERQVPTYANYSREVGFFKIEESGRLAIARLVGRAG